MEYRIDTDGGYDSQYLNVIGSIIKNNKEPKADASNPASVFCMERGGRSVIKTAKDGSQYGVCQLPNGPTVEEWEFYRNHH